MPEEMLAELEKLDESLELKLSRREEAVPPEIRGARTVGTPSEATKRLQAVREAVGPDVKIMIDVN